MTSEPDSPIKKEKKGLGKIKKGFHGDFQHNFRLVPPEELLEFDYDTHESPIRFCNNNKRITPVMFQCKGHGNYKKREEMKFQ